MTLLALVTISKGPLKINLFEPWKVATASLSNLVFGSDLREFINLNASIAERFLSLKSEILVSSSESKSTHQEHYFAAEFFLNWFIELWQSHFIE